MSGVTVVQVQLIDGKAQVGSDTFSDLSSLLEKHSVYVVKESCEVTQKQAQPQAQNAKKPQAQAQAQSAKKPQAQTQPQAQAQNAKKPQAQAQNVKKPQAQAQNAKKP